MTAPNMATITASLERSLQNCSLNHSISSSGEPSGVVLEDHGASMARAAAPSIPSSPENLSQSDTTLELNSHISLPYHWEQCLDLKTGEIYYINWRNGMKAKEDPRTMADHSGEGGGGEEEEEEGEEDEACSTEEEERSCESEEGSSSESPSRDYHYRVAEQDHVLVVAGCKSCLMYFMVPKQVEDCPKCAGHLLHFDRSETANPSSP